MSARIAKGQSAPLNVSMEAKQRIFAGLGWDPNEGATLKDKALNKIGVKQLHHDLDLACYIYDSQKRYISHVSIEAGRETDQTGQIYHSGDNVAGVGDGDDEQISVELKDLDLAIHSIIFLASIKSGHKFNEVTEPEIRLVDGYSGREFLHLSLLDLEGSDKSAFVFARINRGDNSEQWQLSHIGEFTDLVEGTNWAETLKAYL